MECETRTDALASLADALAALVEGDSNRLWSRLGRLVALCPPPPAAAHAAHARSRIHDLMVETGKLCLHQSNYTCACRAAGSFPHGLETVKAAMAARLRLPAPSQDSHDEVMIRFFL